MTVAPVDLLSPGASESDDWRLWISDRDNLQIQVEADGQALGSRVLDDEFDQSEVPALERHRHNGLTRHRLEIDSLPAGVASCTVTIVNPTN